MIIDRNGFRLNVGIVITNEENRLLWCRRLGQPNAWQFPQGGVQKKETIDEAMLRELEEELGLSQMDVKYLFTTPEWLYYRIPKQYRNVQRKPYCRGQKQKWFLLKLTSSDHRIQLNNALSPEFDRWRWVDYWYPTNHVILFKRAVYKKVLSLFEPVLFGM